MIPVCNANTNGATGWWLEPHDIAVAKYFAGREKDLRFTADLWEAGYIDPALLWERLRDTAMDPARRQAVEAAIRRHQRLRDTGRRPQPRRRYRNEPARLTQGARGLARAALGAANERAAALTPGAAVALATIEAEHAARRIGEARLNATLTFAIIRIAVP